MARKRKNKKETKASAVLPVMRPDAAGIDIGATEIFVAVPADRAAENVRSFPTFTQDLYALADWLEQCGIKTVAMESTGVYWIPRQQVHGSLRKRRPAQLTGGRMHIVSGSGVNGPSLLTLRPTPAARDTAFMSPARPLAYSILQRVEGGAWAADLLHVHLEGLEARDAALANEIVFGVLRRRAQLDWLIAHYSGRDPVRLDAEVRTALRMGVYQIRYLERVPPHAAVAETVELVKRARKRSAAGLVNAVLRKVTREPVAWPDRATALSAPEWLLARWEREFGLEGMERVARAFLAPPEKYTRGARRQDIGAQSIVPLLELERGQTFLDLCAAPGNKTLQALEYGVRAVACDRRLSRLKAMGDIGCPRVAVDGARPLPFRIRFDRILVDAPCTGTGTLGRNPEIKWRLREEDIADLARRQKALLENALEALAPGGLLVYSTCSLEREENEGVVERVLGGKPGKSVRRTPGTDAGDGFYAAVIPSP